MKFNAAKKKKLEQIFEELGYTIRYEKGKFNSGHCIVHEDKMVIINRFFDSDGRAQVLFDILLKLKDIDESRLTSESSIFLKKLAAPSQ